MSFLSDIQAKLIVKKNHKNQQLGGFKYRNAEDILDAVKPLINAEGYHIILTDELVMLGNRYYIKATATISNGTPDETYFTTAFAREPEQSITKISEPQITGASSTYARKYALNALLALDSGEDDPDNPIIENPTTYSAQKKALANTEKVLKEQNEKPKAEIAEKKGFNQLDGCITEKQMKLMFVIGKQAGFKNDELKSIVEDFGFKHSNEIKSEMFSELIDTIKVSGGVK